VAEGVAGPVKVNLPALQVWLPRPKLTLEVRGFTPGRPLTPMTVKLGRTLTVKGTVAPADLGGKVTIRVQKRVAGKWVPRAHSSELISGTGTFSWKFTPKSRGEYRVDATIPATAAHRGVVTRFPSGSSSIVVY
jgi:hypothetical protein